MTSSWIVHRDPVHRAALARLVADPAALVAAPGDRSFDAAPPPDAVVLGLGGDFEAELEFVHRLAPRLQRASWLVVCDAADRDEARRLFDTLAAEWLAYPPDAGRLRGLVRSASVRRRTEPLSERRTRDALAARFARWFRDLDRPEFLRALDPHLARVPLLVRGEPGTGRGLLARYLHAFGGTTGGSFVAVPCARVRALDDIVREIERGAARRPAPSSLTVCLEDVDRLPAFLEQELRAWIELAPPGAVLHTTWLRWMGTAAPFGRDEPGAVDLEALLSGILIELPPLRERPDALPRLVEDTAAAWAFAYGERPRRFSEEALAALLEYPWPGNLRELEAVVLRTLAGDPSDPIPAASLRFPGVLVAERAGADHEEALPRAQIIEEPPSRPPASRAPALSSEPPPSPTPATTPVAPAPALVGPREVDGFARRFLGAIAHEIRNPLVPIRTFADLLPQSADDPDFRARFASRVGSDVRRIESVLDRLQEFAQLEPPRPGPVDVAALLDGLLEARRDEIQARRLLVLKELDRSQPHAQVDAAHLRLAVEALLDRVLSLVPERGDLYLASKHHAAGARAAAMVRVLLRYHGSEPISARGTPEGVSVAENSLDLLLAEAVVQGLGGRFTLDETEGDETVVILDLPA